MGEWGGCCGKGGGGGVVAGGMGVVERGGLWWVGWALWKGGGVVEGPAMEKLLNGVLLRYC